MTRIIPLLVAILVASSLAPQPVMSSDAVIELLRLEVPATQRQVWLAAEQRTWQPWLEDQDGFLGRDLYWDPQLQQGVLLIRWNSHDQWKAITLRLLSRFSNGLMQLCAPPWGNLSHLSLAPPFLL